MVLARWVGTKGRVKPTVNRSAAFKGGDIERVNTSLLVPRRGRKAIADGAVSLNLLNPRDHSHSKDLPPKTHTHTHVLCIHSCVSRAEPSRDRDRELDIFIYFQYRVRLALCISPERTESQSSRRSSLTIHAQEFGTARLEKFGLFCISSLVTAERYLFGRTSIDITYKYFLYSLAVTWDRGGQRE